VPTGNPVVPLTPSDIATQVSHPAIRRAALSFGSMSVLAAMAGVFVALGALAVVLVVFSSRWWEIADYSFGAAALTDAHAKIDLGVRGRRLRAQRGRHVLRAVRHAALGSV